MKFLYSLGFAKKKDAKEMKESTGLSGFILHASEKEKEEVFREVGRKANEEQKETFLRSRLESANK